jgi:methylated-DNA-[protein]-cysteine S-methyltransferase
VTKSALKSVQKSASQTSIADGRAYRAAFDSPLGELRLASNGQALTELFLPNHNGQPQWMGPLESPNPDAVLRESIRQLRAYFAGKLRDFDVPVAPRGTEHQRRVWRELQNIPYGATISYGELARRIGRPTASRAVGAANGRNPISIIIPCHRVIGADGTLTGYGGGLDAKRWLIEHEAKAGKSRKL